MPSLEILASLLIYSASIGYGGAISSLGAGLPELAASLNISESMCGQLFAFRGAGYLFGSLLSSKLGQQKYLPAYSMVAFSIYLSGLSTGLSAVTNDFNILKIIFIFQGFGFSLIDVFGAVCLCELWGDRVQPWIQIRSATCSSGAIVGPLLVAHLGYHMASLLVAVACFCTIIFHIAAYLKTSSLNDKNRHLPLDSENGNLVHDHHGMESSPSSSSTDSLPVMPPSLYRYSLLNSTGILTDPNMGTQSSSSSSSSSGSDLNTSSLCSTDRIILVMLSAIMLVFHGVYYVASGWIPTYSLLSGITESRSKAASLLSAYSTALMTGSALSAFFSFYIPKKWILRIILGLLGLGSLFLVIMNDYATYYPLLVCVVVMGLSIGPMYGLILTLPTQLNMVMDSNKTSAIVFGGCIGESILPVFVGWCIGQWGPASFPWSMLLMLLTMLALYSSASLLSSSTSHSPVKKPWKTFKLKLRSSSSLSPISSVHRLSSSSSHSDDGQGHTDPLDGDDEDEDEEERGEESETFALMKTDHFEISNK